METAQQIISIAKELGIRDEIRFFASPWTPPGWMKTPTADSRTYENNGLLLKGGNFNSDYTEELAVYYVRYLEEYAQLGIPVYAMTLQNEPYLDIDYPSCLMTPTQQAELAVMLKEKIAKSSILKKEQVNPQLWGFDHNFEDAWKYTNEISDSEGWKCLDGLAFHSYAGDPVVMEQLVKAFPDKSMHHTERSVWGAGGAAEIITWLRNSSCSYCAWVSMLDSNISTHHWVDTPGPTIFIQNAENPDEYKILPEAYIMGQFARYIRPGYVRVESTECSEDFRHVACKNPLTGKTVLVAANASDDSHTMQVFCGDEMFSAEVPAGTVATYIW